MSDVNKSTIDWKAQRYRFLKTLFDEPEALFPDLADCAELERIENLSDEEYENELRAKGIDPADEQSLDDLLAIVEQKALALTAPTGESRDAAPGTPPPSEPCGARRALRRFFLFALGAPVPSSSSSFVAPFPAWSITLPASLPFPREAFEEALAEHSRLLEKYAERLLALTRERATSREPHIPVVDLTGVIVGRRGGDDEVRVDLRGDAAFYVASCRGVLRPLLFRLDPPRMPIVVVAQNVISLHMASIQTVSNGGSATRDHVLIVEAGEVAVEPLDQEHRKSDLDPLLVTRWKHPDGEDRYAWVPVPPEPANPDDAVDRVLAQYAATVQQKLRTFLTTNGSEPRPLVVVMSVPSYGDGVDVSSASEPLPLIEEWFPTIARALRDRPAHGHVPVFVCLGENAALRWLALPGEEQTVAPPSLLASLEGPVEGGTPAALSSRPHDADRKPKGRKRSPGEVFEEIMRMICFDEIDEVLGTMSHEELDRAIASEGFDPIAERSYAPGFRDRVVRAIANRRLDENPSEGV